MSTAQSTYSSGKQVIFNDEKVENIINKINDGYTIKREDSIWWKNQEGIRKLGIKWEWSDSNIDEYTKCATDILYFAEHYCKIKSEDGQISKINLRDYQYDILKLFGKSRAILLASRQMGKTILASIQILHFILFNNDKNVMIAANKNDTVVEIVDKIKSIYKELPFFLKQGVRVWNTKAITFENGCRIKSTARTKEPAIGFSIDFLYLDEFAHLPDKIANTFYKSVIPTVSSIKNSKIIITSTPNGINLFHKLWEGANLPERHKDKNPYSPLMIHWTKFPSRMDTKVILDDYLMSDYGITREDVIDTIINKYNREVYFEKEENINNGTIVDVIKIKHIPNVTDIDTDRAIVVNKVNINIFSIVTNWEEENVKLMGSVENFDQEFNLIFSSGSKMILPYDISTTLNKNKIEFKPVSFEKLEEKFKVNIDGFKFSPDYNIENIKKSNIRLSIDISEGLGQDYSIINIFELVPKPIGFTNPALIKSKKDCFYLNQIGLWRSNTYSIEEFALMVYLLIYEICDSETTKAVVEVNKYGGELLSHMSKVFDRNNKYANFNFVKYLHKIDDKIKKIGLKIDRSNKKLMVKDYINCLKNNSIAFTEINTVEESNHFVKKETSSGNITYSADVGNDDIIMSVVNMCSYFNTVDYTNFIFTNYDIMDSTLKTYYNGLLNESSDISVNKLVNFSNIIKQAYNNPNNKYI